MGTARDLGTPGRDDQFGAGQADAFAAVWPSSPRRRSPVAAVSAPPVVENATDTDHVPPTRALNQPAAAMASDKSAVGEANRAAAQ